MLLSIVMMVKNEEKFLDKTLKSFDVLRDKIDSELIILDTGSSDNSVNIAKKYTDKVYFEKWNDDFGSMRNKSISYASGDWLLVVDADEVLVEYDELLDFLTNNKYNKYNGAYIKIKNIKSNDESVFTLVNIPRIFKRENFKYEGIIHEQPIYKSPMYKDIALFNHYGYMFNDEEEKNRKLKRNEELLLKQLDENPNDSYTNYQLAKNLISEGKIEESIYYMEKSMKEADKNGKVLTVAYQDLSAIYILLKDYKKAVNLCEKYILKDKYNIDIYFYLAKAKISLGEIENGIRSFERYIYLSENYEISTQCKSVETDYITQNYINDCYINLSQLYYNKCDYNKTIEIIEKLDGNYAGKVYYYLFNSLKKLNKIDYIYKYYRKKCKHEDEKNIFYYELEQFLNDVDKKIYEKISNDFSLENDYYGYLNKCRINNKFEKEKIKEILNKKDNVIYGSLLNIALKKNIELIELIGNLDSIWIKKYLYYAIKMDKSIVIELYKYAINLPISLKIDDIRIYKVILKSILSSNAISMDKYKEIYYIYNMYCYKYTKFIYNNMNDDDIIKYSDNEEERFNIELRNLIEYKYKNSLDYINKLRKVLKEYQNYKKIIEILINDVEHSKSYNDEYYVIKNQFIRIIGNSIESNNINNASLLIDEYYDINGKDSDILNVHGVLCIMQNDLNKANKLFTAAISLDINNEDILHNIEYLNSGELENDN